MHAIIIWQQLLDMSCMPINQCLPLLNCILPAACTYHSLLLNNSLLFCTASINVTNTSCPAETLICDCGTIKWPEITPNVTAYAPCPNGPDGAQANRTCNENGTWESPNTALCATTAVSNSYRNISKVRCSQLLLLFVYF